MSVSESSVVLDLCGGQLHNLDEIKIGEDVEEIDLTENRLVSIDDRILNLGKLKRISFRKNLLKDVSVLEQLRSADGIVEIVLYDNQIKKVPKLDAYKTVQKVDISYNKIRSMQPAEHVSTSVEELYLAANKISVIEGVDRLCNLNLLELGSNRIRKMQNLERLVNLRELWLGRNKIECIECLSSLTSLRRLSVQNNRLTNIDGLGTCTQLEELYLSFNGLTRITGLENLVNLKILDLGNNKIEKVEGLETLKELLDLWMNDNAIATLDGIHSGVQAISGTLTTVYFEGNPCMRDADYKSKLLEWLPKLEQLDSTTVHEIKR